MLLFVGDDSVSCHGSFSFLFSSLLFFVLLDVFSSFSPVSFVACLFPLLRVASILTCCDDVAFFILMMSFLCV